MVNEEVWKVCPAHPHLTVSTHGNVKTTLTGRMRHISKPNHNGYLKVDGLRVNKLVALTFLENPENKPEVNHKDRNKLNNHVTNLEWSTASHNMLEAWKDPDRKPRRPVMRWERNYVKKHGERGVKDKSITALSKVLGRSQSVTRRIFDSVGL